MENKSHALMAGIFTIVLLVAAVLIALWFNRDRTERIPYEIATKLSVPGLNPQAAVRYRGLDVGRVEEIAFDPTVPGQILIRFSVTPDTPITKSTYGTLGYQGVTGIAYVQLDDDGTDPVRLPSSENKIARIEMRPSLFENIQNRGLAILNQTEELAKRVNSLLSPANEKAILAAFDNVSKAASQIEAIPQQLSPTLDKLPALTTQAQQTLDSINALSKDVRILTGNLNEFTTELQAPGGPVAKLSGSAEQVGSVADMVEYEALPLLNETRTTMRSLNRTLENFNQRPQSILFGSPGMPPGPGESGFVAPAN
jgi:phospholipid/cholesterol/gamma-HCH transport system substrate-binding protein